MRHDGTHVTRAFTFLGIASAVVGFSRFVKPSKADPRTTVAAYLHDHLTGADAAIHVVDRLRHTHRGTQEGALFDSLFAAFVADREVVKRLLAALSLSSRSLKRIAGHAAGTALKTAAGGQPGDLALFRTLESLAIAVQGKRCLWRAAQRLGWTAPDGRSFEELETQAIHQWEAIERLRQSLVPLTFGLPSGN
jgi:hypothetical protein